MVGEEGGEGAESGRPGPVACDGGLLAPTDRVGEVDPVCRGVVRMRYVTADVAALRQRARAGEPLVFNMFPMPA